MMKICFDPALSYDSGQGGLRIRYACRGGSIEYTFLHSVATEKNCDIWRMSVVNALDEKGELLRSLTKKYAEWEMAIRLKDRPDFIGGFNHGDEVGQTPLFILDGETVLHEDLTEWREFSGLEISMDSAGFDPASPEKKVLSHHKEYLYDEDGVHLSQEVTWLTGEELDSRLKSYLAMMPPLKHDPKNAEDVLTDSFAFGGELFPIGALPVEKRDAREITVAGEKSGYAFTMAVSDYAPLYPNSYLAFVTDNGNLNYNKMYFSFGGGSADEVPAGTVWRAKTHYRIEKK